MDTLAEWSTSIAKDIYVDSNKIGSYYGIWKNCDKIMIKNKVYSAVHIHHQYAPDIHTNPISLNEDKGYVMFTCIWKNIDSPSDKSSRNRDARLQEPGKKGKLERGNTINSIATCRIKFEIAYITGKIA